MTADERVSERFRWAGLNVSIVSDISSWKCAEARRRPSLRAIVRLHQVLQKPLVFREGLNPGDRISLIETVSLRDDVKYLTSGGDIMSRRRALSSIRHFRHLPHTKVASTSAGMKTS